MQSWIVSRPWHAPVVKTDHAAEPRHPAGIEIEPGAPYRQAHAVEVEEHVGVGGRERQACGPRHRARDAQSCAPPQPAAAGREPGCGHGRRQIGSRVSTSHLTMRRPRSNDATAAGRCRPGDAASSRGRWRPTAACRPRSQHVARRSRTPRCLHPTSTARRIAPGDGNVGAAQSRHAGSCGGSARRAHTSASMRRSTASGAHCGRILKPPFVAEPSQHGQQGQQAPGLGRRCVGPWRLVEPAALRCLRRGSCGRGSLRRRLGPRGWCRHGEQRIADLGCAAGCAVLRGGGGGGRGRRRL